MNHQPDVLAKAGIIGALYILLTLLSAAVGLSSGAIQLRLSEALCVLPLFTKAAVPGLTAGCFLADLLIGSDPLDILFGTAATFLGALGTQFFRANRFPALLCPVISNALILPFVLTKAYGIQKALPYLMITIGAGEALSVFLFGELLYRTVSKPGSILRKVLQDS